MGCPGCGATWPHTCITSRLTEEEKVRIEVKRLLRKSKNNDRKILQP